MRKLSLDLANFRLDLKLVKRRGSSIALLPNFEKIKNIKSGSRFSRFFRVIFEQKRLRRFLGANLAVMLISSPFIPWRVNAISFTGSNLLLNGEALCAKTLI